MHLPARYAHWREPLAADLRGVREALRTQAQQRWASEEPGGPLRVLVVASPERARAAYAELGLEGDPRVPRSFLPERLAVVPLPRDDAVVAALAQPPRTWRESFRHEAAHLESLRYPILASSPAWFREGVAESVAVEGSGALAERGSWPYGAGDLRAWLAAPGGSCATLEAALEAAAGAPSEVRYRLWAAAAERLLQEGDEAPWELAAHLEVPDEWRATPDEPATCLRGRDAHWDLGEGRYLLIAPPERQVELELPAPSGGAPDRLALSLGRTGRPEAGLLLHDGDPRRSRVRVRFGMGGGLAAWHERGDEARVQALARGTAAPAYGEPRPLLVETGNGELRLSSGEWSRRFELAEVGLSAPLQVRAYVRDGAFRIEIPR